MVRTASTMLPLGTTAPDFALPNVDGRTVSLADFQDAPALLVIFLCNHCPYVKHVAPEVARLAREYQDRGVAVVGINSNDTDAYPDDAPQRMVQEARQRGYTFPYLYDATQAVAQAYPRRAPRTSTSSTGNNASCTVASWTAAAHDRTCR